MAARRKVGIRLKCFCLYFKNYLKLLFFIISVRLPNMKRCNIVIKLAILVLTNIIINIIGNVSKLGPHNGKLRFLGDGYKKKQRINIINFYIKQLEIDLFLSCIKFIEILQLLKKWQHFSAYLLNTPRITYLVGTDFFALNLTRKCDFHFLELSFYLAIYSFKGVI